jgi:hypothetical protein
MMNQPDRVEQVEGHKGLVAIAERTIAKSESGMAEAAANVAVVKERIERIRRGRQRGWHLMGRRSRRIAMLMGRAVSASRPPRVVVVVHDRERAVAGAVRRQARRFRAC